MKQSNSQKLTNLEKAIFINDVTLYNAQDNDNHPNIINESNIREKYLAYKESYEISNLLNNNFCLHLNGFSMNNDELLYKGAADEITFLRKYSKEVHSTDLSDFMFNKNQPVLIPDNSDITVIVAAHGGRDKKIPAVIQDDSGNHLEPQYIIKKIRETLELNIQDKDRNTSRDINVKFHSCHGLLITQNKDAMNELEKLSKAFPNSRVNLITEKFSAKTYNTESFLNLNGDLYPTKVFLDGETHPGIFLTEEEIQQSKERLFELLERKDKNTIKPGFTIENFISENQTHIHVIKDGNEEPMKAYEKYMKDLNDKIQGHLIHIEPPLKQHKKFYQSIQKFKNQSIQESAYKEKDKKKKYIKKNKDNTNNNNNNQYYYEYIKKYEFETDKKNYKIESKKFMQKLQKHDKQKEEYNAKIEASIVISDKKDFQNQKSIYESTDYRGLKSLDFQDNSQFNNRYTDKQGSKFIEKNSNPNIKSNDSIDQQKSKLLRKNSNPNIKSNITTRSSSVSSPASKSSFVEKLKKEREERSKSQPNSKGRSL